MLFRRLGHIIACSIGGSISLAAWEMNSFYSGATRETARPNGLSSVPIAAAPNHAVVSEPALAMAGLTLWLTLAVMTLN
jgi:hypothetical protein